MDLNNILLMFWSWELIKTKKKTKKNCHHKGGYCRINVVHVKNGKHTTDLRESGWIVVGVQGPISNELVAVIIIVTASTLWTHYRILLYIRL